MLKNKRTLKIIALLVAMVICMSMLTGCEIGSKKNEKEGSGVAAYEEPVKNLVEGLSEANSEKFLSAFPTFISDYVKDIFTDEYMKTVLESSKETYGDNLSMTYKVTKTEEISADDLKSKQEDVKETYGNDVTITKGYKLSIDVTTKGNDKEDTDSDDYEVFEIDGKWCIIDF